MEPTVTLFTKPGCHLCESAAQVIERARARRAFRLVVRNILEDSADFKRYRSDVPVVHVDGREIARHRLTAAELEAALDGTNRLRVPCAVALMAKYPAPGQVKTRLMPPLSPTQAAHVHEVFLEHLVHRLSEGLSPAGGLWCFCDPPRAAPKMQAMLGEAWRVMAQAAGDLGGRLVAAFEAIAGPTLFLGCDSPDVPAPQLAQALAQLDGHDVVLGPAADGGYWCLGLGRRVDARLLLPGVAWSSGQEMAQTLERAGSLGYNVAIAGGWDDVDHPKDLDRLLGRLRVSADPLARRLLGALAFLDASE